MIIFFHACYRYEIIARNDLNTKLSEINSFLEDRAKEQAETDRNRDKVMENIQQDLGERLEQSRVELATIKEQMSGKHNASLC